MGCKISVDKNNDHAGERSYYLVTSDCASLESRVAAQDTCLNDGGIDPILYDLYRVNSPLGEDMHTASAFSVFGSGINKQSIHITDENGKMWVFIDESQVKIKRDGKEMIVHAPEIVETDEIIDYYDGD